MVDQADRERAGRPWRHDVLLVATLAQRHHLLYLMVYMHAHRGQLDYPFEDKRTNRDMISWALNEQTLDHVLNGGGRWQGDCSEYGSYLLKLAGCWHWTSPGYTGSHLETLPVYTNAKGAMVGALVVFGPATGHHEAMVKEPDPTHGNPLLSSHGRAGLDEVRLHDLAASQAASGYPGVRLLSIAHL
jgi:hypothetical protein